MTTNQLKSLATVHDDFLNYKVQLNPDQIKQFLKYRGEFELIELINKIDEIIPVKQYPVVNGIDNPNNGKQFHFYRFGREYSNVLYLRFVKAYLRNCSIKNFDLNVLQNQLKEFGSQAGADESWIEKNDEFEFVWRFWWD